MSNEPTTMEGKVASIYTDMKWVKEGLHKKANKWVERAVGLFMVGTTGWALTQVANLIDVVKAVF